MKTFKDLKFKQHHVWWEHKQARLDFANGYWVSVLFWSLFQTDIENPYELAVFKNGEICYDTWITDDVIWHLNKKEVENIMIAIQKLPMKTLKEKLLEILPTHYNKPAFSKVKELIEKWETHFCKSSPGDWRYSAIFYHLDKKAKKLFMFETERSSDLTTMKNFFAKWETKSSRYHKVINL